MSVLIKGMEMPTTGLYFVSVDNTGGRDKTVVTVERMLGNRDVRQIVGSFELVPVPKHGRLIDADALADVFRGFIAMYDSCPFSQLAPTDKARRDELQAALAEVINAPTIIPAEEGE